jgi:hypothetical protein
MATRWQMIASPGPRRFAMGDSRAHQTSRRQCPLRPPPGSQPGTLPIDSCCAPRSRTTRSLSWAVAVSLVVHAVLLVFPQHEPTRPRALSSRFEATLSPTPQPARSSPPSPPPPSTPPQPAAPPTPPPPRRSVACACAATPSETHPGETQAASETGRQSARQGSGRKTQPATATSADNRRPRVDGSSATGLLAMVQGREKRYATFSRRSGSGGQAGSQAQAGAALAGHGPRPGPAAGAKRRTGHSGARAPAQHPRHRRRSASTSTSTASSNDSTAAPPSYATTPEARACIWPPSTSASIPTAA